MGRADRVFKFFHFFQAFRQKGLKKVLCVLGIILVVTGVNSHRSQLPAKENLLTARPLSLAHANGDNPTTKTLVPVLRSTFSSSKIERGLEKTTHKSQKKSSILRLHTTSFPQGLTSYFSDSHSIIKTSQLESNLASTTSSHSLYSDILTTGTVAIILTATIIFTMPVTRRRFLPLLVIFTGLLLTSGIVLALDIPLSILNTSTPAILTGFGAVFLTYFQGRHKEEYEKGKHSAKAASIAVNRTGHAIATATTASVTGFGSLLLSRSSSIRDFGTILTLGVIVLYLLSLLAFIFFFAKKQSNQESEKETLAILSSDTPLPAPLRYPDRYHTPDTYLSHTHKQTKKQQQPNVALIARSLITSWSTRTKIIAATSALLLAIAGYIADINFHPETGTTSISQESNAKNSYSSHNLPQKKDTENNLYLTVSTDDITAPEVLTWMAEFEANLLDRHPEVLQIQSLASLLHITPHTTNLSPVDITQAISEMPKKTQQTFATSNSRTTIVLAIKSLSSRQRSLLTNQILRETQPPIGVQIFPPFSFGSREVNSEDSAALAKNAATFIERRRLITFLGCAGIFLSSLAVYRRFRHAIVHVLPVLLSIGWASGIMWLANVDLTPLTATLGALIAGSGAQFSILLIERYLEERQNGKEPEEAMNTAVEMTSPAIITGALFCISGFVALSFSSLPDLRPFGLLTALSVALAFAATITIVPSTAVMLDHFVQTEETLEIVTVPVFFDSGAITERIPTVVASTTVGWENNRPESKKPYPSASLWEAENTQGPDHLTEGRTSYW